MNRLPFPTVVGFFAHWKEEPPIAMSIAALAGFKRERKMTEAEEGMLAKNTKVVDMKKLPANVQKFFAQVKHDAKKKAVKKVKRAR